MRAIYGQKKLMSQIYDETGMVLPVTVIEVPENWQNVVVGKTAGQVLVGAGAKRHINKPLAGQLALAKAKSAKLFSVETDKPYEIGSKIGLDIFEQGEKVNVTGISKGKGFQGTVKRHHFNTGPRTHGSNNYRQPGSIGSTFPQRVVKGRRMGGQMGAKKATVQNLKIVKIDNNRLFLLGAVPGPNSTGVLIWSPKEKEGQNES